MRTAGLTLLLGMPHVRTEAGNLHTMYWFTYVPDAAVLNVSYLPFAGV